MSLGEFDIIARYFDRPGDRDDVLLGIGDDAAVLSVPEGRRLVLATDTIVEGVHFPAGIDAADIGHRALAVNLSDLAAMGAEPAWMTLSLSLPRADSAWLDGFARGLFQIADRYQVALVGGDTVRGPMVITIQIAGFVETDRWLTRRGARPGDGVFISGVPGEAAAGLAALQRNLPVDEASTHLRTRFLHPEPRVRLGRALRSVATAAMDVSDGLVTDLAKLCHASACGARITIEDLPQSAAMASLFAREACVDYALAGGDDYEIMFTVAPERQHELAALGVHALITRIGVITANTGVVCRWHEREYRSSLRGYDHFASGDAS
jgi:thiamine-monophosphate kinase